MRCCSFFCFFLLCFGTASHAGDSEDQTRPETQIESAVMLLSTPFLEQGFEDATMPPSSWSTVDSNPTHNWMVIDATTSPPYVHDGGWAAWVNYDASNPSDEWLRSHIIDLTGVWDATASFWAYSATNYCPSGGTGATMLFHVTNPANIAVGLPWDMCVDESWPTLEYRLVEADLGEYHDQIIKVAWRYTGQDGESFGLDDVAMFGTPAGPVLFPKGDWPMFAQQIITLDPDPTAAGSPTELCAQVVNLDVSAAHGANIQFAWTPYTIGGNYTPINGPRPVTVSPGGADRVCLWWIPPISGSHFVQATLSAGYQDLVARRNLDLDTTLQPLVSGTTQFFVYNPTGNIATVTLGLIPHLVGWTLGLSPDTIIDLAPGAQQSVTLTFTPPANLPIPGTAVVDVEAYIGGELIGGFRKLHYPPHIFADGFESGGSTAWSAKLPKNLD